MPNPATYQFNLPQRGRPSDVMLNEVWYPGIQAYWETSTSSRIFDAILGIKALVIHATAGSSSAGAISVMKEGKASFHWLLPDEDEPQHGELILIPNGEMYSSTLTIHKAGEKRRLAMTMSFKFDSDIPMIKRLIGDAIVEVNGILDDPRPGVLVSEVNGENITLTINFWIDTDEHRPLEVFDEAAMAAVDALRKAGMVPSSVPAAAAEQPPKTTTRSKGKIETEL